MPLMTTAMETVGLGGGSVPLPLTSTFCCAAAAEDAAGCTARDSAWMKLVAAGLSAAAGAHTSGLCCGPGGGGGPRSLRAAGLTAADGLTGTGGACILTAGAGGLMGSAARGGCTAGRGCGGSEAATSTGRPSAATAVVCSLLCSWCVYAGGGCCAGDERTTYGVWL